MLRIVHQRGEQESIDFPTGILGTFVSRQVCGAVVAPGHTRGKNTSCELTPMVTPLRVLVTKVRRVTSDTALSVF
ncbi:hypothetical protein BgiMline_009586 [Biomphalaria glabrata]